MSSMEMGHEESPSEDASDPVARIEAALAVLEATDVAGLDPATRAGFLRDLEQARRRVDAVATALLGEIDAAGCHSADGHWSARSMIRHIGQLSGPEAAARDRVARALRHLPETAAAYRAGHIGTCQARRLARTWANPRIRHLLPGAEGHLVDIARTEPYRWFDHAVTAWERLADQDGTIDDDTRREDARIRRSPDGHFELLVRLRSGRGAITEEVFEHHLAAEVAADWDAARAEHGDDATWDHLPRTDPERRADAFMAMVLDAASTPPDAREPRITIDLVIDHDEYLHQCAVLAGDDPPPPSRPETRLRSHTASGTWVDPWDIASFTIGADLRRVVIGADSAVIDLGRRTRCFTGTARDAVMLRHPECAWAGCHTSSRRCQADHATPHSQGGPTNAANGQPLCGPHNRHKHRTAYRVWCDPTGAWHTTRPDGTDV